MASISLDTSNQHFTIAAELVNHTSRNIFLTGKAGTGKTTFLRYIREHTSKNAVVTAPTGVAAINAGGVTLHSFFQLPFSPFVPDNSWKNRRSIASNQHTLLRNIRIGSEKKELIQELELLIIDEVSMVRCDMLDAVDTILRRFRKKWELPFGGVQVLFIGDLYQLPPVIPDAEWDILSEFYEGPFFFQAWALAEIPPLYIELKKIYRQEDQQFIDLLNRVRNNEATEDDLRILNGRYQPDTMPVAKDHFITLTTHNYKAEEINSAELEKLPTRLFHFEGLIKGDFLEKTLPTDMVLHLKEGSLVMFVKNDSGSDRKYFNGKLATISSINNGTVMVSFNNQEPDLELKKETWKNIRYILNRVSGRIEEEEIGSFTQYPIRLAWAITIHKGQGLTFEKAVIDAGASFAPGQVYVALSRLTSLDGMVLHSKIHSHCIATDKRVIDYAKKEMDDIDLLQVLEIEKHQYLSECLMKSFDWDKLLSTMQQWVQFVGLNKASHIKGASELASAIVEEAMEFSRISRKFRQQLIPILEQLKQTGDMTTLKERMQKAIQWFADAIKEKLLEPLQNHINDINPTGHSRNYLSLLRSIEWHIWQHRQKIMKSKYGDIVFYKWSLEEENSPEPVLRRGVDRVGKRKKGDSLLKSLSLFRKGHTMEEIAQLRVLTLSTIETHLASFVRSGEIDIYELLSKERVTILLKAIEDSGSYSATAIKQFIGDRFTYGEIKFGISYYSRTKEQNPA